MPMQQGKSGLGARYGQRINAAVAQHAQDETDFGFQRLPPGINNGVAQLTKCYFDTYKTGESIGEYYFRAEGTMLTPASVMTPTGPAKVAGLTTSIMFPVCDKKTSKGVKGQAEFIAEILNEMRKLGADTSSCASADDMENLAKVLEQEQPYFKVRTSQSAPTVEYPNPRIWENWDGTEGLENYDPAAEVPAAQYQTDQTSAPAPTPKAGPGKGGGGKTTVAQDASDGFDELDQLAAAADDERDAKAAAAVTRAAKEAGITAKDVDAAQNWREVVQLIKDAAAGTTTETTAAEEEPAEEPEEEPAAEELSVTDVVRYVVKDKNGKPAIDPKTKKPVKPAEFTITALNGKKETASLKSNDNPKVKYDNVPWDELIRD